MRSALYAGALVHVRHEPRRHAFRYPVAYWLLDLDELPEIERRLRLVSVNRRNVLELRDRDHFGGELPLKEAVRRFAGDPEIDRVLCLTQLRVLGYVFNPVSFYWCYRADGELACMIAELNNTFGERLPELLPGSLAALRARQAVARLAVHGPRSAVPLRVLRAGGDGVRPHRGPSGRPHAASRRSRRPAARADEPRGRALPRPLSAHAAPGDGAHPLERGQALGQARAVPPQAAVRARDGARCSNDHRRSRPASLRRQPVVRSGPGGDGRARARPSGNRGGSARPPASGRIRAPLRSGLGRGVDAHRRLAPPRAHRAHPEAGARRVVPGRRVALRRSRPAPRAASAQRRRRGRAPPGMATLRGGSAAHQPPHRPARRAPQHRGALRPRQRLLRALPRRDDDLLVRDLRGRGRASAEAQRRKLRRVCEQLELTARRPRARDRLRLGFVRAHRRRRVRSARHRRDDLAGPGGARAQSRG